MILVSMPAGEEESGIDVKRPADGLPVVCASFRFSAVDEEFIRVIGQGIIDLLDLRIGPSGGQFLKQVSAIHTGAVIGDCIKHLEQIEELWGRWSTSYVLRELEKIEILKGADNEYRLDHAVTARQKEILKAFGLTASNVQKQAAAISSDLARIEVEEFEKAANEQMKPQ